MGFGFLGIRGKVGAGALAVEANDPNVNALASDGVDVHQARCKATGEGSGPDGKVMVLALNGTTITVQPWFFESTTQRWWPFNGTIVATPAAPGTGTGVRVDGAPMYMQVKVCTGVEQFCWYYG